jgi:hypothetical protein
MATEIKGESEDEELDFWSSLLFLMGYLELSADEFWDMQYNELIVRNIAYQNKRESGIRHQYEIARWQTWLLIQPHIDSKKSKINTPQDLMKFAWDQEASQEDLLEMKATPEQIELFEKLDIIEVGKTQENKDSFEELFKIGQKQKLQ